MQSELRRLEIVHWQIIRTESTILKLSFSIYIPCHLARSLCVRVSLNQTALLSALNMKSITRECVSEKDHGKCEKLFSFFSEFYVQKLFKNAFANSPVPPLLLYQSYLYLCIIRCVFVRVST